MTYEQKMKDVDRIESLCERATSSKYSCPQCEETEGVVQLVLALAMLVSFSIAVILGTKVAYSYEVPGPVIAISLCGLCMLFAITYVQFMYGACKRISGEITLLIQRMCFAQAPTWQQTISSEFQAYSPVDKIAYDALMSQRDEAGYVTLEQVRSWHAKEIQALKSLQEVSSEQEVRKICISQPE